MHLLLPPSESKRAGGRGKPLRDRAVTSGTSTLADARTQALASLHELVSGDPGDAARALALPPGVAAAAIAANAAVLDSPTMPALRRYTGVVYDGFAVDELTASEQRVARRCTLIFSGLFGVLRGDEPVPDYRVPAKAVLPGLGIAGTWWRPLLTEILGRELRRGLIVDLRSTDYRAMWRPDAASAGPTVAVRILSPTPRGGYGVVSFTSKIAKGRLAAALVRAAAAGNAVESAADVVARWRTCPGAAPTPDPQPGAGQVDLLTT